MKSTVRLLAWLQPHSILSVMLSVMLSVIRRDVAIEMKEVPTSSDYESCLRTEIETDVMISHVHLFTFTHVHRLLFRCSVTDVMVCVQPIGR